MSSTIHLEPEEERLVREILTAHFPKLEVRVFGSRVTGHVKPMSDLDLCIIDESEISDVERARLADSFSDSRLPFKFDVVYRSELSPRFAEIINQTAVPFR